MAETSILNSNFYRIGSDRTHKTWIGSNSIKEAHIYSLKVDSFQIPTKNGQVVSLDQDEEERDQESDCHCAVFAFSSPFCREDFLFIVMGLHSVNYFMKRMFFSRGRDLRGMSKRKGTESVCQGMYRIEHKVTTISR